MKRIKITKLVVFMLTLVLMLAVAAVAMAKGDEEWKKVNGSYTWKESAQYSNGTLDVKPLGNGNYLFLFDTMRGSEAENSSFSFHTAELMRIDNNGVGIAEFLADKKPVKLTFTLKGKSIFVKQTGTLPADLSGEYIRNDSDKAVFEGTDAAAIIMPKGLDPAKTGLNSANSPYRLVRAMESVGGFFYDIRAVRKSDNKMFARFLVSDDLTMVYRQDNFKAVPKLIYGTPESLFTVQYVPLDKIPGEDDEEESADETPPGLPEGATEESADGTETGKEAEPNQLSAVVRVGPAAPLVKVGESTKMEVYLPGNLSYKLTDLKSSASDKVSVDEKGNMTAKAEGTATISGKITVDGVSREFKREVIAYVPKLECDMLPTKLEINEKLKLEAYITEGDAVKPQWSVSDSKIAEIKGDVLTGKADGLVDVTAKTDKMTRTWKVAVGKAELPKEKEKEEEESSFSLLTLALPVVLIGGGAWWFLNRRKK